MKSLIKNGLFLNFEILSDILNIKKYNFKFGKRVVKIMRHIHRIWGEEGQYEINLSLKKA